MIDVKKALRLIRYKVADTEERQYSDYDVMYALNEAIRYITQSKALVNSDFLEKIRMYNECDCQFPKMFAIMGVPLPEDYITLVGVTRLDGRKLKPTEITNIPSDIEYKITNDKIYTGATAFVLAYKKSIPEITEESDEIELPNFLLDAIVKTSVMILQQAETDILMQVVDDVTRSIVPRRRYVGAETKMPFYC